MPSTSPPGVRLGTPAAQHWSFPRSTPGVLMLLDFAADNGVPREVASAGGMPQAAAALAMSERTLRRQLASSGTAYQSLLDEVRQALAEEMLDTGVLSVEDVAHRLGYAEASSFIHAFKRWRGETPARYRLRRGRRAAPGSAG